MRNLLQKSAAALTIFIALSGCSKQDDLLPSPEISQQSQANGTIFDFRGDEYCFEGQGSAYNLTGLTGGCIQMVRKNFIEAANGMKIITQWESKTPLDPALYAGYRYSGTFVDQDPNLLTNQRTFEVIFTVDANGVARAKLTWTGR